MAGWLRVACLGGLLGTVLTCMAAPGIYTCIDAKGRRLTSDRMIMECNDREQKLMNPSGTVRATLSPPMTAQEQAAKEKRDQQQAEEKRQQAEQKRVERALVTRYPNQAVHDTERSKALLKVEGAVVAAQRYMSDLQQQRQPLVAETEFFKGDPAKYPAKLKRLLEENDQQIAAQQRLVANQVAEKRRVNARFDEELARLRVLWDPHSGVAAAPVPADAPIKR